MVEFNQNHARKNGRELHQVFMDLTQAFDRLEFWAGDLAMERLNFPDQLQNLMNNLNQNSEREVITRDGTTESWTLECGVPQGEVLSPLRFIAVMDMLATWITKRCQGHNPKNKKYGYRLTPVNSKQMNQLAQIEPSISQEIRIIGNMFCDDIQLTTETFEDMQDLVGIVQEFMGTFGIPINANKSYYTANIPHKENEPKKPITQAPSIKGKWSGGMDGKWEPNTTDHKYIAIKQIDEPIRYLGVHFAMNGSWDHQVKIIKESLNTSLLRIRTRGLPPEQLTYLINTIIIPKITFPLNASSILTRHYKDLTSVLDKQIAHFVIEYLGYPKSTNHAYIFTKTKQWGLGLQSITDQATINTITNTAISLNDLDQTQYWAQLTKTEAQRGMNPEALTIQAMYCK